MNQNTHFEQREQSSMATGVTTTPRLNLDRIITRRENKIGNTTFLTPLNLHNVVPMGIFPMENWGRCPQGKPAATELRFPTLIDSKRLILGGVRKKYPNDCAYDDNMDSND